MRFQAIFNCSQPPQTGLTIRSRVANNQSNSRCISLTSSSVSTKSQKRNTAVRYIGDSDLVWNFLKKLMAARMRSKSVFLTGLVLGIKNRLCVTPICTKQNWPPSLSARRNTKTVRSCFLLLIIDPLARSASTSAWFSYKITTINGHYASTTICINFDTFTLLIYCATL